MSQSNTARSQEPVALPALMIAPQFQIFLFFMIGYFLSNFFRAANAVIAGDLSRDIGLSAADLGFMTSLFYIGFAAVQLPLGVALDRFGQRLVLPSLMLLSALGAMIFANATSFATVALGRTLIGIGMAGGLMGILKAFGIWFPPQRVATISGIAVGAGAAGALVAATPLAIANASVGWRIVFVWAAGATLVSAALILFGTQTAPSGVRWRAEGPQRSGGFAQIFRDPRFWRLAPLNFFVVGTLLAVQTLWAGPYLFDVLGLERIAAGNFLLAMSGGVVSGYVVCGWLSDRFGARRILIGVLGIFTLLQTAFFVPSGLPQPLLLIAYYAFGLCGAFNLLLLTEVRTLFPSEMSGRAVTALNLFGFSGSALLQWWMGLIIASFPAVDGRYPGIAYAAAFSLTMLGCVVTWVWYVFGQHKAK